MILCLVLHNRLWIKKAFLQVQLTKPIQVLSLR